MSVETPTLSIRACTGTQRLECVQARGKLCPSPAIVTQEQVDTGTFKGEPIEGTRADPNSRKPVCK
jgi:hypothetical protein